MVNGDKPGASLTKRAVKASVKSPVDMPFKYNQGIKKISTPASMALAKSFFAPWRSISVIASSISLLLF
jgi:hypothetical protein